MYSPSRAFFIGVDLKSMTNLSNLKFQIFIICSFHILVHEMKFLSNIILDM